MGLARIAEVGGIFLYTIYYIERNTILCEVNTILYSRELDIIQRGLRMERIGQMYANKRAGGIQMMKIGECIGIKKRGNAMRPILYST